MAADPVVREVKIAAPPEVVFAYFTERDKIERWHAVEADVDPRPGGVFRMNITGADVELGEYLEVDPPKRIVHTFGWEGNQLMPPGSSRVEITFEPDGDFTIVRVTHTGLPEESAWQHAAGWEHYLLRLTLAATGSDPGPDAWRRA